MIFVKNKRRRLARSYSMWCVYCSGLLSIAPYFLPYIDDWIPKWASIAILAVSPLAYVIHQPTLKGDDNAD
ncbi:hypothetical protein FHT87_005141 [Rhizobium sp. BK316]|nr:hypothetical protein [Rhizobium sp. BK316]